MPPKGRSGSSFRSSSSFPSFRSRPSYNSTSSFKSSPSYGTSQRPSSRSRSGISASSGASASKPVNKLANGPKSRATSSGGHAFHTTPKWQESSFAYQHRRPLRTRPQFVEQCKHRPRVYHCLKHDYYYFDCSYYDTECGRSIKKGYYDESENYYETLDLKEYDKQTVCVCKCEYCDSSIKLDLNAIKNGESIQCPNCSANLNLADAVEPGVDYFVQKQKSTSAYYDDLEEDEEDRGSILPFVLTVFTTFILLFGIPLLLTSVESLTETTEDFLALNDSIVSENAGMVSEYYDYSVLGDTIYVPEIDRVCEWDGDYYYDSVTDCYFCYNANVEPAVMQYWYEEYSSQYGDYGWLEYVEEEHAWFVETGYNRWEKVENVPDYFWYTSFEGLLKANETN